MTKPPLGVARMVVEHGWCARLAVRGGSMRPLLREPMTLDVVALDGAPRLGDVLVFRLGDDYVAHRLVGRRGNAYVTSGDAHPENVEYVNPAEVLGRVRAVWSDATPTAQRVDTDLHRALGFLYARVRPFRLVVRRLIGAWKRPSQPHPEV